MTEYSCDACQCAKAGKKAKNNGLSPPAGWKRIGERLLCQACAKAAYSIRAVTIRVASPVDATWQEFREALRYAWSESTRIGNWAVRQLAMADQPIGRADKIPPRPKVYLYGAANEQGIRGTYPADATLATLTRAEALYQRDRAKILRGWASLPTMRSPQPYSCKPCQSSVVQAGERIAVKIRIPTDAANVRTFTLLVAQGPTNWRTTAALKRMMAGDIDLREVSLIEQGAHVMAKFVGLFPRVERPGLDGTLYVRATADCFCECISAEAQRIWCLHADLALRWIAEHQRRLQRLADDRKSEKRGHASKRGLQRYTDEVCDRHRRRMKSFVQQSAAAIAGWAERRRVSSVLWDDWPDTQSAPNETPFESFSWAEFRGRLEEVLALRGVTLIRQGVARSPVLDNSPESLALA